VPGVRPADADQIGGYSACRLRRVPATLCDSPLAQGSAASSAAPSAPRDREPALQAPSISHRYRSTGRTSSRQNRMFVDPAVVNTYARFLERRVDSASSKPLAALADLQIGAGGQRGLLRALLARIRLIWVARDPRSSANLLV
jgi:hypothetical protein